MASDHCPKCRVDLRGEDGYRTIGHQVLSIYDGTLFWECPDCGHAWPRFSDGGRLGYLSQEYSNEHNWARELREKGETP
jgi:hypothetical protein